jgi:hypothetical protein
MQNRGRFARWRACIVSSAAWVLCFAGRQPVLSAEGSHPVDLAFFESRIRPVLVEHCEECHSNTSDALRGGLRVDSREALLAGGDSGPAVVPGKPDESLLLAALRHDGFEMPPSGRLPAAVIEDFAAWISSGATDPRDGASTPAPRGQIDIEAGRQHWAFQSIRRPDLPPIADAAWPLTSLDHFVLARLEAADRVPTADADRATWLRRVTFDLAGLPPTPTEIDAFLADASSEAFTTVVDRLLASPQFGERMARHWLDLARFAESSGGGRSLVFKEAWRYRDYVIDAFNSDMPIDQFIVEQLAGDLLPAASPNDRSRQLIATAYLMLGAINYEEQDKRFLEMNVIDEQLDTLGQGLMGMTLGCARCHDHKFDPIPTDDYYALAGILKSTKTLIHRNVSTWTEQPLPMPSPLAEAVAMHDAEASKLAQQLEDAKQHLAALDPKAGNQAPRSPGSFAGLVFDDSDAVRVGEWTASTFTKPFIGEGYVHDADGEKGNRTLTFQPRLEKAGRYDVRLAYTTGQNRATNVPVSLLSLDGDATVTVNMREPPSLDGHFVSLGTFAFDTSDQWFVLISNEGTDGHVVVDGLQFLPVDAETVAAKPMPEMPEAENALTAAKAEVARLEDAKKALDANRPEVPQAMAAEDAESMHDCAVCIRGDVHNSGRVVPRGVLQVAVLGSPPTMPAEQSGRVELASWIADRDHPLTSRVFVNRVWQHLFGQGLVTTPDNFGTTGQPPSHPDLLDFLARQFTDGGWSAKTLIREITLSRTYRQAVASDAPPPSDPSNALLAGVTRRRLDAECLRDAILSIAGTLDQRMGGPGISDPAVLAQAGSETPSEYTFEFSDTRRSIYTPAFRNRRLELFEVFDAANPNAVVGQRPVSTVSTQGLYLLNSPFVMEQAAAAAKRLLATPHDTTTRIDHVFRECVGREPSSAEREAVRQFIEQGGDDEAAIHAAWAMVFQSLFGCIDFRTLE